MKIKDRPRANRPATERVRSSDQVSWACVTNAKLKRDVGLGALFLRLDLVTLPFLVASWSLRRMFLAMDSTNLNARQTQELWPSNASSLRGVKKGVALNHGIRYLCPPNLDTMAKKGNRIQVILECTEHKDSGMPGTSRYVTTKNRKNTPDRMEIKKFNPVLRRYTMHKEIK